VVKLNLIAFSLLYLLLSNLTYSSAQDKKTGLEEMFAIFSEEEVVINVKTILTYAFRRWLRDGED